MDELELDDLEVIIPSPCMFSIFLCYLIIYLAWVFVQMDEEERYNRRLEAGLYTLQVGNFLVYLSNSFSSLFFHLSKIQCIGSVF